MNRVERLKQNINLTLTLNLLLNFFLTYHKMFPQSSKCVQFEESQGRANYTSAPLDPPSPSDMPDLHRFRIAVSRLQHADHADAYLNTVSGLGVHVTTVSSNNNVIHAYVYHCRYRENH